MKIAIASEKNSIEGKVSKRAGRAEHILIFEDGEFQKSIKNPFAVGGGGAGFGVIRLLSKEKVKVFVAGEFGQNLIRAMEDEDIKGFEKPDMQVAKAVEEVTYHDQ